MSNSLVLIETLVSTIARAFYTDTVVVLLEGLMHEKYIIEEELGPRLKLTAKDVRKITTQLENEPIRSHDRPERSLWLCGRALNGRPLAKRG